MKKALAIKDSFENKLSFGLLASFLLVLPYDRFYSEVILIAFIFHTLIHINKERLKRILRWQVLLLCSVFFLTLLGMGWSHDEPQVLKDLTRQSAILLFPVFLSTSNLNLNLYKKRLFLLFGTTTIITILYLYADALRIILYNHLPLSSLFSGFFINHNFSSPIGIHATYLAMYTSLSLAIFLHYVVYEQKKILRYAYAVSLVILSAGLLQLASKAVLIATVIFVFSFALFFVLKREGKINFAIVLLVVLVIPLLGITSIESFKKRYITELKGDLNTSMNSEIAEPRAARWLCALSLIRHSPVIGYGSGSEKRLLKEKYFDKKLYTSYLLELNAHNEYLSILIKTGVVGLIIFLFTLLGGLYTAWLNRDAIFGSFLILISMVSLSENILDVNKGVFFYAFFFSYFILSSKPLNKSFRLNKRT